MELILREQLGSVPNVYFTSDIWTETCQTRSFHDVTVHINENWTLGSTIFGVYELHESHTAQHLANHLTKTCLDWGMIAEKNCNSGYR
ncbi:hypothetical protein NPIL_377701 [Nephila pilipes]|uniref:Uncharacterized protein n=1 Tax=Nephila pilipes TaxID=299642 RepID=A0A8X6NPX7_NEPPI|nr:hypothetical protein NPIL_377701 [Nephila pilipes]